MNGFPTPEACRAAAQLGRTVGRALDGSALSPAAYRLLAYLSSGTVAAAVLAEKLAVSRPTVTATTDWLVERGFATRQGDEVDRRRVFIEITQAGAEALEEADRVVGARLLEVLQHLDPQQGASVLDSLDQLFDALRSYRTSLHQRTTPAESR